MCAQVQRTFIAGRAVTEKLVRQLVERGYDLHTSASFEDVCQIKEKLAYVALDFDAEFNLAPTNPQLKRTFELPTENVLSFLLLLSSLLSIEPVQIHTSRVQLQLFNSILFGAVCSQVELDVERFECAEPLFDPKHLGRECPGAHELVKNALDSCERSLHGTLLQNVLLTGGCARLPGFRDRLTKELKLLCPNFVEHIR